MSDNECVQPLLPRLKEKKCVLRLKTALLEKEGGPIFQAFKEGAVLARQHLKLPGERCGTSEEMHQKGKVPTDSKMKREGPIMIKEGGGRKSEERPLKKDPCSHGGGGVPKRRQMLA